MARRYNPLQAAYIRAKAEFEQAEAAFRAELADAGLTDEAIEAAPESALEGLGVQIDAIAARWHVSDLSKAMWAAETDLINWALDLTVRLRPSSADNVAVLRLRIHKVKSEVIALALKLPA